MVVVESQSRTRLTVSTHMVYSTLSEMFFETKRGSAHLRNTANICVMENYECWIKFDIIQASKQL